MKRIDRQWWKGNDGYYYEVANKIWEGPYPTMQRNPDMDDSTVVDSGEITVFAAKKTLDNE